MLLKMALETLASDMSEDVFLPRFDAARKFALTGEKSGKWWYMQYEDMNKLNGYIKCLTIQDWMKGVELLIMESDEFVKLNKHVEFFRFQFLFHIFIVPLVEHVIPLRKEELSEPEERIFIT
jgi:hypothetical protein